MRKNNNICGYGLDLCDAVDFITLIEFDYFHAISFMQSISLNS